MDKCTFDRGFDCVALSTHDCEGCPFRKTKKEPLAGRRKARAALQRLPKEHQDAIMEKYYEGNNVRHEI